MGTNITIYSLQIEIQRYGIWSGETLSGKIIAKEDDTFYGYAEEWRSSRRTSGELNFILGAFAKNQKGKRGMAFFRFTNERPYVPEMIVFPDLSNRDWCQWGNDCMYYSYFAPGGYAEVGLTILLQGEVGKFLVEGNPGTACYAYIEDQYAKMDKTNQQIIKLLQRTPDCIRVVNEARLS